MRSQTVKFLCNNFWSSNGTRVHAMVSGSRDRSRSCGPGRPDKKSRKAGGVRVTDGTGGGLMSHHVAIILILSVGRVVLLLHVLLLLRRVCSHVRRLRSGCDWASRRNVLVHGIRDTEADAIWSNRRCQVAIRYTQRSTVALLGCAVDVARLDRQGGLGRW